MAQQEQLAGFSSLPFTANLMPEWPEFRFPTTILCS
jgi:hypothetical protein